MANTRAPNVRAICWTYGSNYKVKHDVTLVWSEDSSPQSLAAFTKAGRDPYFRIVMGQTVTDTVRADIIVSQELQSHRKEIDQARKLCKKHGRGKGDEG